MERCVCSNEVGGWDMVLSQFRGHSSFGGVFGVCGGGAVMGNMQMDVVLVLLCGLCVLLRPVIVFLA